MTKNNLLIFTRNPELGKVKTRLAKSIGDENALEVYKTLLQHTQEITKNLNCSKQVYYSNKIVLNDIWEDSFTKKLQQGNDLGERMMNAFKESFDLDFEKVIIIGSDMIDISPKHISAAFDVLEKSDIVIGPAQDGGYYLLGMKQLQPDFFVNKAWGTNTVFKKTIADIEYNKLSYTLLEELNDIDVVEDIKINSKLYQCIRKNNRANSNFERGN